MGSLPGWLPGYQHVSDPVVREKFESAYGVTIDENPGLNNIQMLGSIEEGKMKAMYLVGEDMAFVDSDAIYVDNVHFELEFFLFQHNLLYLVYESADIILIISSILV